MNKENSHFPEIHEIPTDQLFNKNIIIPSVIISLIILVIVLCLIMIYYRNKHKRKLSEFEKVPVHTNLNEYTTIDQDISYPWVNRKNCYNYHPIASLHSVMHNQPPSYEVLINKQ
ncbi:unnamed protein product [Heterobilharzia americana]|nr:unnamed protein product [Heterobilharzia americana]